MSLSLKLVEKNQIRKLSNLPRTLEQLNLEVRNLFGDACFQYKYFDEDGDKILIRSDQELTDAYETTKLTEAPSLKILLEPSSSDCSYISQRTQSLKSFREETKNLFEPPRNLKSPVWENHTCDGCNAFPIQGTRYECSICSDFDFCEHCEATLTHPHAFLKISSKELQVPQKRPFRNFRSSVSGQVPKMKLVKNSNSSQRVFEPKTLIEKTWLVQNTGQQPWPEGCYIQMVGGNLTGEPAYLPCAAPNQQLQITLLIEAPEEEGFYSSYWRAATPEGNPFGPKLYVSAEVKSSQKDLSTLMEMGFTEETSKEALATFTYDLNAAINSLLNKK